MMQMGIDKWLGLLLVVFLTATQYCTAEERIFSCGGFVKSPFGSDFSKIEVALYTEDGSLKYRTDCAPNNGYYMIPVYSTGHYVLKIIPPPGWLFDPESVDIHIDGETDKCSRSEDINFNFKGFSVFGQVISGGSADGPEGLLVDLINRKDQKIVGTAKTGPLGKYEIKSVLPGQYRVSFKGDSVCYDKTQVDVDVAEGEAFVKPNLQISGYSLTGSVLNDKRPVANVALSLYSKSDKKLIKCSDTDLIHENLPKSLAGFKRLCVVKSDAAGKFTFPCVPPGSYSVVPYFKDQKVTFDVVPKVVEVVVSHTAVVMKDVFEVKGFSVSGRVLWKSDDVGVPNAQVFVNGKLATKTAADGSYVLEQMTTGKYEITAKLPDISFTTVKSEISPNKPNIPDVTANEFNLCGSVSIKHPPLSGANLKNRKILVTRQDTKEAFSVTTEANGQFCKMVARGVYLLEPHIFPEEKQAGLSITPASSTVTITTEPVKNVDFKQLLVQPEGILKCLGPCGQKTIQIFRKDKLQEALTVNSQEPTISFKFSESLPGSYVVEIKDKNFCWDNNRLEFSIDHSKNEPLTFSQLGFVVVIAISHDATLVYEKVDDKSLSGTETLKVGQNSFCLSQAGTYQFQIHSCHQFDKENFVYETSGKAGVLQLTAVKHLVSGVITSNEEVKEPITVKVSHANQEFGVLGPLEGRAVVEAKDPQTPKFKWEFPFKFYVEQGKQMTLEPIASVFLFSPTSQRVSVGDACVQNVAFKAVRGLFLDGAVTPPLDNVEIVVTNSKIPDFKKTVLTDAAGHYRVGPLRSLQHLEFSAEKPGFILVPVNKQPGHFSVHKLSELTIKAVSTDGHPLSNVLISLTGGHNYRSNNKTHSNGTITFVGLSPGDYFMRPILKEYNFEPPTKMVAVQEGSTVAVDMIGKRVAFSCYGKVRTLNGQAIAAATVEAVADDCDRLHEENVSDNDGFYRVSGLQPGCSYQLSVKNSSLNPPATAAPNFYNVKVADKDIQEKDFVVLPEANNVEIFGEVKTSGDFLSTLKITLYREDNPDSVLTTISLGKTSIFHLAVPVKDGKAYVIKMESSLNANQYKGANSREFKFTADRDFLTVAFDFEPQKKHSEAELSRSSYMVLPLMLIVAMMAYHHAKVLPVAQQILETISTYLRDNLLNRQQVVEDSNETLSAAQIGGFGSDPSISSTAKKKFKTRKT